jgi:GNAT superfamily N-acetyltransferase
MPDTSVSPSATRDTVSVREANATDLPSMTGLFGELGYAVDLDTLTARFHAFTSAGERTLVAERAGVIIGLATLHMTPVLHRAGAVGRVTALVVNATSRGTGAGAALMRRAEAELTSAGCVILEVTSNRSRTDAHTFYERLGYTATSYKFGKTLTPTASAPAHPASTTPRNAP